MRRLYVVPIPLVGPDGKQLQDEHGTLRAKNVVIGPEGLLRPVAAAALKTARAREGISLPKFMSGYGSPVNDPEALWDRQVLARMAHKLTRILIHIVLLSVVTLFLAALIIEVAMRKSA